MHPGDGSLTAEHVNDQDDEPDRRESFSLPLQEQVVWANSCVDEEHSRARFHTRASPLGPHKLPVERLARLAGVLHGLRPQYLTACQCSLDILIRSPGVDEHRRPQSIGCDARAGTSAVANEWHALRGCVDTTAGGWWLQSHHERARRTLKRL